jgi:hypothetical protein
MSLLLSSLFAVAGADLASAKTTPVKIDRAAADYLSRFRLISQSPNFKSLVTERTEIDPDPGKNNYTNYSQRVMDVVASDDRVTLVRTKDTTYYDDLVSNHTMLWAYSFGGIITVPFEEDDKLELSISDVVGNFPSEVGSEVRFNEGGFWRVIGSVPEYGDLKGLGPFNVVAGNSGVPRYLWSTRLRWVVADLYSDPNDSGPRFLGVKLGSEQIGLSPNEAKARARANPMAKNAIATHQARQAQMWAQVAGLMTAAGQLASGQPVRPMLPSSLPPVGPIAGQSTPTMATLASASGGMGAANSQSAGSANGCPNSLTHISGRLPNYADAELQSLRNEMLAFDPRSHFDGLVAQGHSPREIASAAAQQAGEAQRAMPSAEAAVREVATSPEQVMSELQAGTFRFSSGVLSAAARAWAIANYMVVANRETAVIMACMAR